MSKTVLITGTSSGFGAATANFFASKGWNVIATMRDVNKSESLEKSDNIFITKLDVQDRASIETAIAEGIDRFGSIEAVINNAGYGLFGIFESASRDAIQNQFDVNVFGAMDVVRAILTHFRANNTGTIVNISSGAGIIGFPNASIYNSSKFALEGWSEALRYELASIGVKVRIVEPGGAPQTAFLNRVGGESKKFKAIEEYVPFLDYTNALFASMAGGSDADAVEKVVAAIYEATIDTTDRLRYAPTSDIQPLLNSRRSSSEEAYNELTNSFFMVK